MDDSNKKEFATLYYSMGEYYEKKVSTDLLLMFFSDLMQFSIEQVKEGARLHRRDPKHGSFFPKPPDIMRHIQTGDISTEEKAELAWAQVIGKIRSTGSYGTLKLDDKQAIAAVKALGSWQQLCSSTETEMTWKKKEFISMYETYERTPTELLPSSLPGIIGLVDHKKEVGASMQRLEDGVKNYRLKNKDV